RDPFTVRISQLERLNSNETKIAPRSVWIAVNGPGKLLNFWHYLSTVGDVLLGEPLSGRHEEDIHPAMRREASCAPGRWCEEAKRRGGGRKKQTATVDHGGDAVLSRADTVVLP